VHLYYQHAFVCSTLGIGWQTCEIVGEKDPLLHRRYIDRHHLRRHLQHHPDRVKMTVIVSENNDVYNGETAIGSLNIFEWHHEQTF